jgi:hypothetical protein
MVTGYGLNGRGFIPGRGNTFLFSIVRPTQPPILEVPGGVKLTIHFRLMPKSRKVAIYLNSLTHLHGIALN